MITSEQLQTMIGQNAVDNDGDKIGTVGQVYLDDTSGEPVWVTLNTGLFGTSESFVPLEGASVEGDTLRVAYPKAQVKDAPSMAADGHIEPGQEDDLYAYYGLTGGTSSDTAETADTSDMAESAATGTGTTDVYDQSADASRASTTTEGHDTSGPTTDQAMTRSEEQLRVGTETREAGRARLRKYVVTEQETASVAVSHDEVTVEREPITDANADDAFDGPAISEEEHEVVLTEERPVVATEAVPVERVKLGTQTVTEQEEVTADVRKEQIETDGVDVRDDEKARQDRR